MSAWRWLGLLALVVLLVGSLMLVTVPTWGECRTEGHSFVYCLNLVGS